MARDRKRHAKDTEAQAAPSSAVLPSQVPVPTVSTEPHPCLIQIVRLMARQAAKTDVAAQQNAIHKD